MARLLFRDSQGREGAVELSPTEIVYVGRGLECAIRTDDGMVSRRHAQIRMENGAYVIEDLGSANGVYHNNNKIQKSALGHADVAQCGSLMIRFLDENAATKTPPMAPSGGGAPPPKKGGTMVLAKHDVSESGGGGAAANVYGTGNNMQAVSGTGPTGYAQPAPVGYNANPQPMPSQPGTQPSPYGAPPGMPAGRSGGTQPQPYGGPPAMPMPNNMPSAAPYGGPPAMPGAGGAALPYGGPPAMPGGGAAPGLPYGGPPAMPGGGDRARTPSAPPPAGANPSMFGRGGVSNVPAPGAGSREAAENKVMVDLGLEFDPQKADADIKGLRGELEKANANFEREVADGKRVRAEAATLRERIEELRAQVKDRDEQVTAHDRVADELRDELQQTRNDLVKQRNEMGEMAENMAARERQAARALEDTAKLREDMEDKSRQLLELSRTKDEGWKKLNDQLTEIEHLREVINEQERMLEERRVGLISQEEVIKELRTDKEKNLKFIASLKAERDEAAGTASRYAAQVAALEEENKRMGRLLVEAQTDSSRGGRDVDHMLRVQNDLKESRVEFKKIEADRERLSEQYERAERDREKLEGRLAQIEVELQEALHGKLAAESARNVAQDALAKAEVARHKAAEEALHASKARDAASTGSDDAKRELERLRRRVAEFEKLKSAQPSPAESKEIQLDKEAMERKLKDAVDAAAAAERGLKALQAEVDAAKTDAAKARAEAARAKAAADAEAVSVLDQSPKPGAAPQNGELQRVAGEVYEAINDILSDMRNNMVLVQGELPQIGGDGDRMKAITDAVEALVDGAENAKGALRSLRDLAKTE